MAQGQGLISELSDINWALLPLSFNAPYHYTLHHCLLAEEVNKHTDIPYPCILSLYTPSLPARRGSEQTYRYSLSMYPVITHPITACSPRR